MGLQNPNISGSVVQKHRISGDATNKIPVTGFVQVGSKPIRELWFGPRDTFPRVGSELILYVDTNHSVIYYWTGTAYIPVSGHTTANIVAKTKAEWATESALISQHGWVYIYTDYRQEGDYNIPAIKIGDGHAYVIDLPFFTTGVTEADRSRWDNKVSAKISSSDNENLVLYTD